MDNIIGEEIEKIKSDIPQLSKYNLAPEYLFSMVCQKYFYNECHFDIGNYKSCFVDGKNDGGIDLITDYENDTQQANIVLIQSKFITELENKQDIIDVFTKMDQTINNFRIHDEVHYNDRLKRIFKDKLSEYEDQAFIFELVLFLNVDLNEKRKKQIEKELDKIESLKDYDKKVYFKQDIIARIRAEKESTRFVPEAKVIYAKEDGIIKYNDGILINIYAHSIKDLYHRFKDNGLFEQNFRYYIRHKKIDNNIKESLNKNRALFWYFNNGIIIGCSDFRIDGRTIKLYDFSIINGCQTTTLIGQDDGAKATTNFVLPCKIVKSEKTDFIAAIAEASNSQKPISDRDLKSNYPEQRQLQRNLRDFTTPVYMEIKRGEKKPSKRDRQEWQFPKNELLGQLILSVILQQPGTARSNKKKIFSDNKVYSSIFKRNHKLDLLVDILKLNYYYKHFIAKREQSIDQDEESVVVNGTFIYLAIIGFFIKAENKIIDISKVRNPDEWENEISTYNSLGSIFSKYNEDDFEDLLEGIFAEITALLYDIYQAHKDEEKTVSNFFKTDKKYRDIILKSIIQKIYQNKIRLKSFRDQYFVIFNTGNN